jgi:hypothetical protein
VDLRHVHLLGFLGALLKDNDLPFDLRNLALFVLLGSRSPGFGLDFLETFVELLELCAAFLICFFLTLPSMSSGSFVSSLWTS